MSDVSWIRCREHAGSPIVFGCSETRLQELVLELIEQSEFVKCQEIELFSLVFVDIFVILHMTKLDARAIVKTHDMFLLIVFVCPFGKDIEQWQDDRCFQFWICTPEHSSVEIWSRLCNPYGLESESSGLPWSCCTSKEPIQGRRVMKYLLLWEWIIYDLKVIVFWFHRLFFIRWFLFLHLAWFQKL